LSLSHRDFLGFGQRVSERIKASKLYVHELNNKKTEGKREI